jgi:hypothetical protein
LLGYPSARSELQIELEKNEAEVYVCASPKMLRDVGTIMGTERVRLILFGQDEDGHGQRSSAMADGPPQVVQQSHEEGVEDQAYEVAVDWKELVEMCSDRQSARRASV